MHIKINALIGSHSVHAVNLIAVYANLSIRIIDKALIFCSSGSMNYCRNCNNSFIKRMKILYVINHKTSLVKSTSIKWKSWCLRYLSMYVHPRSWIKHQKNCHCFSFNVILYFRTTLIQPLVKEFKYLGVYMQYEF